MADSPLRPEKAPWHLWVVGIASLLWNCVGAWDFLMTQTRNSAYLSKSTPDQLEFLSHIPGWVLVAWALGVFGAVLGSIFLLLRKRQAVCCFVVSLVGMVVTNVRDLVFADQLKVYPETGTLLFAGIIFLVALLLWIYARTMRARGVLT